MYQSKGGYALVEGCLSTNRWVFMYQSKAVCVSIELCLRTDRRVFMNSRPSGVLASICASVRMLVRSSGRAFVYLHLCLYVLSRHIVPTSAAALSTGGALPRSCPLLD